MTNGPLQVFPHCGHPTSTQWISAHISQPHSHKGCHWGSEELGRN